MRLGILCAVLALGIPSVTDAACQHKLISYNEPAQRLDQTVQRLARRSGCFVEVDLARYGARRTAAIKGAYKPQDALMEMVRPIGLVVTTGAGSGGYRLAAAASPLRAATRGRGTNVRESQREARIHRQANAINQEIDAAVRGRRISAAKGAALHRQVGRVQVEAGHIGRTEPAMNSQQAAAFDAILNRLQTDLSKR